MVATEKTLETLVNSTNDAASLIKLEEPYAVVVGLQGTAPMLFHRWSCEDVEAKGKARKNSAAKKTDNVEAYVNRDEEGFLCLPGEYLRMSICNAAKFKQDPRSPRKSAYDLFKAGIAPLDELAKLNGGVKE